MKKALAQQDANTINGTSISRSLLKKNEEKSVKKTKKEEEKSEKKTKKEDEKSEKKTKKEEGDGDDDQYAPGPGAPPEDEGEDGNDK